jgi:hypothetical protein
MVPTSLARATICGFEAPPRERRGAARVQRDGLPYLGIGQCFRGLRPMKRKSRKGAVVEKLLTIRVAIQPSQDWYIHSYSTW